MNREPHYTNPLPFLSFVDSCLWGCFPGLFFCFLLNAAKRNGEKRDLNPKLYYPFSGMSCFSLQ
ncbi:hypothetical protein F5884DRAFT_729704 [Xylogone sp. PMI_703]|nr:hypothetical protein F5884DRAFT_729704 [Xylogone sp. PMI_703]